MTFVTFVTNISYWYDKRFGDGKTWIEYLGDGQDTSKYFVHLNANITAEEIDSVLVFII